MLLPVGFCNINSTLSLIISGGLIPTVRDVGTLVGGSPNKSCKDIFAFFAFQSQRAISIPAKAHAGIFKSLPLWWTSYNRKVF